MRDWIDRFDYSDIRLLAACLQHRSLNAIALRLGTHRSTISRRLDRLEHSLGFPVVLRHPDGYELSREARELLPAVLAAEQSALDLAIAARAIASRNTRRTTVQMPEGLGTHWISKFLDVAEEPLRTQMKLVFSDVLPDFRDDSVDFSIQYADAADERCVQRQIASLNLRPYATRKYAERFGLPQNLQELGNHQIACQIGPHDAVDLWQAALPHRDFEKIAAHIKLVNHSGSAQYLSVTRNEVIGALPSYAEIVDKTLIPLDLGLNHSQPVYLVYRKDLMARRLIIQVKNWLGIVFGQDATPFFRVEQASNSPRPICE